MLASPTEILNFREIYQTEHISRAAIRLGISQPSLTQSLQRLEEKLGSPLFLRTKQGVIPTTAGKLFYAKAHQLIENWRELEESLSHSKNELIGRFRVGCHASVASYTLPGFFKELNRAAPKLDIELVHDFSRKIVELIVSHELDLGFVVNPVRHPDLVLKKLGEDQVRFFRARKNKSVPKKLFTDASLNQVQQLLSKAPARPFLQYQLVQTSSLELIRSLVSEGHGIGILPARVAEQSGFDLITVDEDLPTVLDEIYLAYRRETLLSRAGKELIRIAHLKI